MEKAAKDTLNQMTARKREKTKIEKGRKNSIHFKEAS